MKSRAFERITSALWMGDARPIEHRCFLQEKELPGVALRFWIKIIWTRAKQDHGHYGNKDCRRAYHDYREMMARKDIDAVMLAVPDNWARVNLHRSGKQ